MAIIKTLGELKQHIQNLPDDLPLYITYSEDVDSGTVEVSAVTTGKKADRGYSIVGSADDV